MLIGVIPPDEDPAGVRRDLSEPDEDDVPGLCGPGGGGGGGCPGGAGSRRGFFFRPLPIDTSLRTVVRVESRFLLDHIELECARDK
jgi:hypothetical protein